MGRIGEGREGEEFSGPPGLRGFDVRLRRGSDSRKKGRASSNGGGGSPRSGFSAREKG